MAPRATRHLTKASIGALGVVYGDIGTSPLYALKQCFNGPFALEPTEPNVLGVVSLVFWALTLVVSVKYLAFVMRADNQGEGGILALLALLKSCTPALSPRTLIALTMAGLFGAALLFGDG